MNNDTLKQLQALVMSVLMSVNQGVAPDSLSVSTTLWVGADLTSRNSMKTSVATDLDADVPVTFVNKTTYILTSEVTLIVFMCQAPYPVEWGFSNSKWMLSHENSFGIYSVTNRRNVGNIDEPGTFTYMSQLGLIGDSRIYNGVFTCKKINSDDPNRKTNFTLYWQGGPYDALLVLAGKNVTIYPDKDDRVIFPCHVNNPFANVTLWKDNMLVTQQKKPPVVAVDQTKNKTNSSTAIDDQWIVVPLSDNLKYQPEVGFIFQKRNNIEWLDEGNYKCTSGSDDDPDSNDFVLINFSPNSEPRLELDNPIRSKSAKISREGRKYECCSSGDKPPKMTIHSCGSPTVCEEVIPALKAQQINLGMTSMSAAWNRISIPRYEEMMNSVNGSCASIASWFSQYDVDAVQCIGEGINVLRKFTTRYKEFGDLAVEKSDTETLKNWVRFDPSPTNRDFNFRQLKNKSDANSKLEVYVGEPVKFQVIAPLYYFAHGIRFIVKYTDGSKNILPEKGLPDYAGMPTNLLPHWSPLRVTTFVNFTEKVESLTCYVPVWNSPQWITKTLSFSIKAPTLPTIAGELVENVYFTLNDTDKWLTCSTKAEPEAKVMWLKDSQPINGLFNASRHADGSHILKLPKVTHEIQGEFRCISMNFVGKAEKIFNVFVEESRAGEITTIIIVTMLILAVAIAGGIVIWKTFMQKKTLENLRAHVYPDPEATAQ